MRLLDRRVQVLFSQEQYRALQSAAAAESRSVGSIIREAVDQRAGASAGQRAFEQFIALSEAAPEAVMTAEEWRRVKDLTLGAAGGSGP
jgi:uncharacterized protein (DUF1778 family)